MANNKTATDQIHNALNSYFNTRENPNWKALVEAIGESDQDIADLIVEIRKQFFIATASRPYLDRLAANYKVSRPKVVGMDDATLRRYVPILAYQPKQVKAVIDDLLDIFFFKESTTAFTQSADHGPYTMKDGWELEYMVDNVRSELITFYAGEVNDISSVTAAEIAAAINRQAKYSFSVVFNDKITGKDYVRIFTKTIGSKGSIMVTGGRADIALKFNGFISTAGSGPDTQWIITKIGDTMRFMYSAGAGPNIFQIAAGYKVIVDIPGNTGTFTVTTVNISDNYFEFQNLLGTPGTFNHATNPGTYVRFISPERVVVYTRDNRSVVWETDPGKIIIEMPATPPVVRRNLKGSAHLNGPIASMLQRVSDTSIKVDAAADWPNAGQFVLRPAEEVKCRIVTPTVDEITTLEMDTDFDIRGHRFSYSSKTQNGNGYILSGISPSLPVASGVVDLAIASIESDSNGLLTVETTLPHRIELSGSVLIYGITPEPDAMNGVFEVIDVIDANTFTCQSSSDAMPPRAMGTVRIERIGLADAGSPVYLTSSIANTGIYGPYMYDTAAPFIVSSYVANTAQVISTGNIVLNLAIDVPNNIPDEQGFLIFDYGLNTQEGPVRYLYKASDSTLALDPAYVFKYNHDIGATITAIRRKGAVVLSGLGKEYAFYVSDPAMARQILQDLIAQVKSVGLFLEYIIRYPKLYYSDFDVYSQTNENDTLLGLLI
jgi:hypothetical protein